MISTRNISLGNNTKYAANEDLVKTLLSVCTAVEALLIAISLWLVTCMIVYGMRTNKWKKKPGSMFLNDRVIYIACFLAIGLAVPRFIWSIIVIHFPRYKNSDRLCEILLDITGVTFTMALGPTYIFLWLRQRALYSNPAIRQLTGKCANIFSWCLIIGLTIGTLTMTVVIQVPDSHLAVEQGCIVKPDMGYETNFYIVAGILAISQLSLLCLFVYSMTKSKSFRTGKDAQNEPRTDESDSEKGTLLNTCCVVFCCKNTREADEEKSNVLENTIRRTIIATIVAVISDTTMLAIASFAVRKDYPISIPVTLYDCGILINAFCILMTFSNHRRILTVFCNDRTTHIHSQSSSDK